MLLRPDAAITVVKDQLFQPWLKERDRLDHIDRWYRWDHEPIRVPRKATQELKVLAELSKTPWLNLVVTNVAQCMYVDGYRSTVDVVRAGEPPRGPWKTWNANDFDQRQIAVHRAGLAFGYCFVKVLPGEPTSVMRGVSPRKMYAVYGDPASDDWPMYAMQVEVQPGNDFLIRLYDEEYEYFLTGDSSGTKFEFIEWRRHGAGVCPVVRYCNQLDLDGRATGEVEPFIPAARRINRTSYDRMVTQHYSSWKVRTVAGLAEPDSEEEANRKKLQLRQDDLLVAEDPDTKFGTLDETPLDGFISAWRADIEGLAAVSQSPTHAMTGQLVNLSAEALAAARAGLTQKVFERQKSFGKAHKQALQLAAALEGDEIHASDDTARVTWQDMEIRSMSQAVDALGKAAQMLMVPVEALWARIPGVEKSDVDEWNRMADEADPMQRLQAQLERQARAADTRAADLSPNGIGTTQARV